KLGLLIVILAFGSTVETAWQVRNRFGMRAWSWGFFGGRFNGPSYKFDASQTETVAADTAGGGGNTVRAGQGIAGAAGAARIALRKVVYLATEGKAREFSDRIQVQARREGGALHVGTNRADLETGMGGSDVGFETHFDLVVPPNTPVKVTNAHGMVDVSDVAR